MEATITPQHHSKLSLSAAKRWMKCAGSIRLSEMAPKQPTNFYAAEGTAAHKALEDMLIEWIAELEGKQTGGDFAHHIGFLHDICEHGKHIGECCKTGPGLFQFQTDADMLEAVKVCFDYVVEIYEHYRLLPRQIKTEGKVKIPGHDALWGTSDIRIYIPYTKLVVIDYKHGKGVKVDAAENEQCMAYAVGAYNELPPDEQAEISMIEVVIVQPRAVGPAISIYEFPVEVLKKFHIDIVEAAVRTENPNAPLAAGEWCRFCPAKLFCGEYQDQAKAQASIDFANVPAAIEVKDGIKLPSGLPDFRELPLERLAMLLKAAPAIEQYLKDAEKYAENLHKNGTHIPGYKLVDTFGNRKWADERATEDAMLKLLANEAYAPRKLISPAQFEKTIKKVYPNGIIEQRQPYYDIVLNNMHKPYKGVELAPDDDKRTPSKSQALVDFANEAPQ